MLNIQKVNLIVKIVPLPASDIKEILPPMYFSVRSFKL